MFWKKRGKDQSHTVESYKMQSYNHDNNENDMFQKT